VRSSLVGLLVRCTFVVQPAALSTRAVAVSAALVVRHFDNDCRGGPPWPPQRTQTWGGHGGPPLQNALKYYDNTGTPGVAYARRTHRLSRDTQLRRHSGICAAARACIVFDRIRRLRIQRPGQGIAAYHRLRNRNIYSRSCTRAKQSHRPDSSLHSLRRARR